MNTELEAAVKELLETMQQTDALSEKQKAIAAKLRNKKKAK